ncbi:MAG: hypothetical protein ACYDFU_03515 [Nitrospirota bacterium]
MAGFEASDGSDPAATMAAFGSEKFPEPAVGMAGWRSLTDH